MREFNAVVLGGQLPLSSLRPRGKTKLTTKPEVLASPL